MKFVTLSPLLVQALLRSYLVEKLSLVNSKDIPVAFCLHYVDFPQVPICHLLDCIFSI